MFWTAAIQGVTMIALAICVLYGSFVSLHIAAALLFVFNVRWLVFLGRERELMLGLGVDEFCNRVAGDHLALSGRSHQHQDPLGRRFDGRVCELVDQ